MEDQNIGLPTTASASYKDFIDKYTYLCAHYSAVIAFHGSVKLSATIAVSRKAANEISHKTGTKITVVDMGKSSAELVLRASQELDAGLGYEELLDKINEWSLKIELISTTTSLQHALRSGRLKNRGLFRLFKNIKPTFRQAETGDQKLISVSFTEKWSLKRTQRIIEKVVVGKKIWGYSITHANNNETARWFADQIEMHSGKKARYINQVSPSIGALVGPGAVAILIMFE